MGNIVENKHKCGRCQEWKVVDRFTRDKAKRCGLGGWCKTCCNAAHNRGYALNPKRYLERTKRYYIRTKSRYQERARNRNREIKTTVMSWYGGKCRCCGESRLHFLSLDHIYDDGAKQRGGGKGCGGGEHFYRAIVKNGQLDRPKDLQVLCWNCQMGKRFGYGFCLHHLDIDLRIPEDMKDDFVCLNQPKCLPEAHPELMSGVQ